MANHRIAPKLRERGIMHKMPPYNWNLRQDTQGKSIMHQAGDNCSAVAMS